MSFSAGRHKKGRKKMSKLRVLKCIAGLRSAVGNASERLTGKPEVPNSILCPAILVSSAADSRRAFFSCWRKFAHLILVNRLGCLSLLRNNVVRVTDHPDMTITVYYGR